jgi:hypothetical protein
MKVSQLRATLEEFAAIHESAGSKEKASALRALAQALRRADDRAVKEVIPAFERAAAVAVSVNELAST